MTHLTSLLQQQQRVHNMKIKIKDNIEDTIDDFKVMKDGEIIPLNDGLPVTMMFKKDQVVTVGPNADITARRANRLLKRKFATEVK